jgi:hypothetical protein
MPNVNTGASNNVTLLFQGTLNPNNSDAGLVWGVLRVLTAPDASVIAPTAFYDQVNQSNTQSIGTLTILNPSGTATDGQRMTFRITSNSVQTYSWGSAYHGSTTAALPASSSGGGARDYIGFIYDLSTLQWDFVSIVQGF